MMGEVFKEVKEKFERFKFDVVYLDREYQINANIQQVPIPIGERNAFTGIIVNNGSAILTITLVKVAHASTNTQTSDVGTVTLNPGQALELKNFPVNEIQVTYNPNSVTGSTSIVQVKGVIHPLFESPVSLNITDIISLQQSNQNLLVTANTTINNGVYDTIVISQNLTVNINGFVIAKKLVIENNANVNVNGVLIVVDEVQSDGQITVANFMSVKKMYNNGYNFYINEGAYVIADEIIFSPNMTLIDYNGNGNGNLYANFIYFQTYSATYLLGIYANVTAKIVVQDLMEITAGSLTELSITNVINSVIDITGSKLLVKFVKNATISSLNAQVSSSYFEFDNAYMPDSLFTNNGPGNQIYIIVRGNSIVQLNIDSSLYSYVFFRKNENGEGNIQSK